MKTYVREIAVSELRVKMDLRSGEDLDESRMLALVLPWLVTGCALRGGLIEVL